jgi:hypothetical protein
VLDPGVSAPSAGLSVSDDGRWVPVVHGPADPVQPTNPWSLSLWDTTTNHLTEYGTAMDLVAGAIDATLTGAVVTADGSRVAFGALWLDAASNPWEGIFRIDRASGTVTPVWKKSAGIWGGGTSQPTRTVLPVFANRHSVVSVVMADNGSVGSGIVDLDTGVQSGFYATEPYDFSTTTDAVQLERALSGPWDSRTARLRDMRTGTASAPLTVTSPLFVPLSGDAGLVRVAGIGDPVTGSRGWVSVSSCP